MKKTLRTFAASALVCAAAFFTFVACSKDDDTPGDGTVAVTGVTLTPSTAQTLNVGETLNLTATVSPDNATNKAVTWTSSSTVTATVNAGTVTAVAEGTTTITVTTADGGKTASVSVTVSASGPDPEFNAPDDPITAPSAGGTYDILVTSNLAWTVAVDAASMSWCTVEPAFESGNSGNGTVTVTVRPYSVPNAEDRAATVTFTMPASVSWDPLDVSVTQTTIVVALCEQCLWDGSAWVDGYVSEAYTGINFLGSNNEANDSHIEGTDSNKDGRANTAAILSAVTPTDGGIVKICQDLGEGWYVPAYEEMINISEGTNASFPPLNGQSGANLLVSAGEDWSLSSTEYYLAQGRITTSDQNWTDGWGSTTSNAAVRVHKSGSAGGGNKGWGTAGFCVWRQP
jgi:hypothetical protein